MLDIALGKSRVKLGELCLGDIDAFLRNTLRTVDLRELRGFKPLRDLLTFRPESNGVEVPLTLSVETLDLSPDVLLINKACVAINLDTHFIQICNWLINPHIIFNRHETNEQTSDLETALSWGRSAYLYSGDGTIIALRRPHNHSGADQNIAFITYWYEKVLLERRHVITKIEVTLVSIEYLSDRFGDNYTKLVTNLIHELRFAHARTLAELESQVKVMRSIVADFERRSDAITY